MSNISSSSPLVWVGKVKIPFVWVLRALLVVSFGVTAASLEAARPTTEPPSSPSGAASSALSDITQDAHGGAQGRKVELAGSGEADALAIVLGEQIMRGASSSDPLGLGTTHDATSVRPNSVNGVEATATQAMAPPMDPSPSRDQPPGIWRLAQFSH